jgi:hypothetical protein
MSYTYGTPVKGCSAAAMKADSSTAWTRSYLVRRMMRTQLKSITESQRTFLRENPGRMSRTPGIAGIRTTRQLGISTSLPSW